MTRDRYRNIYDSVTRLNCSPASLQVIKEHFANEIDSRRRSQAIQGLPQLLQLLEKRDVLNEDNLGPFQFIASVCNCDDTINLISHYKINNASPVVLPPAETSTRVLPRFISDKKTRIYRTISEEIGDKWKDLARALEIPEGLIDELQRKHPSISKRMREILVYHEENNSRLWKTRLMDGLSEARRNDLRKHIQHIIDNCD